ncbi:MAG: hypothetical protein D6731_15750 [Planctomycetota bacterium]|nr:MAG: hypothetical protein D6731_15750 [Planctomycetota bacterium]
MTRLPRPRTLWPLAALVGLVVAGPFAPRPAEAGVVVLKNGEVIVGRLREDEITKTTLVLRWPYKEQTERGEMSIPRFRVRWFDAKADEPTDEYWEQHGEEYIDEKWRPLYEKWKLRKQARDETPVEDWFDPNEFLSRAQLSTIPVEAGTYKIQSPEEWDVTIDAEHGITIFTSRTPGTDGFHPRIHVFTTKAAIGQTEDQMNWIEAEIARAAGPDGSFEVRERKRPRTRANGFDQEIVTQTTRFDRPVMALRKVHFRRKYTYFFTAYAHEKDYSKHENLFRACLRSLKIKEDERGSPGRSRGSGPSGASSSGPGSRPASGGR